ncbi:hypothetical protein DSO57_1012125 [Entomophthora muscae]|uniref:Uncharacterized protein n=1 Tax=Entomophthora muscae TaxID=34485 RepID=A0ACC2T5Z4_9FUNG|nr:hypothetical protein DSO57_1012125 [Entomophthora muscae]
MACSSGEGGSDLHNQPFLRDMIKDLQMIKADMNQTAPTRTEAPVTSLMMQRRLKATEEALVYRMVKYSAAAYCLDLTLKTWTCKHCQDLTHVDLISVEADVLTGGRGFIAVDHSLKSIIVTYRGSYNLRSFLVDMDFGLDDLDVGDGTRGIKVHVGFLEYAEALGQKLIPILSDLLTLYNYTVTLTGHSLGAAAATLTSIYVNKEMGIPWSNIQLVTFGEPRTGNEAFARWFNHQSSRNLRVVNNRDIIAHVPYSFMGYFHRKREVFISNGVMQSCISDELEDSSCSSSKKYFLDIMDHIHYLTVTFGILC